MKLSTRPIILQMTGNRLKLWRVEEIYMNCLYYFQVYKLNVYKKQIPRYVKLADAALAVKYECPVSLSPLFQPITIKDSEPRHTYSGPIIDQLTKTSKIDPLSELPLCNDWRIEDLDLDKEMSDAQAYIPLSGGGIYWCLKISFILVYLYQAMSTEKLYITQTCTSYG